MRPLVDEHTDRAERVNAVADDAADRAHLDSVMLLAAAAALAVPSRTRPLAVVVYGAALSRAHGASLRRVTVTIARLFDERRSVAARVDTLGDIDRVRARQLEHRIADLERLATRVRDRDYDAIAERVGRRAAAAAAWADAPRVVGPPPSDPS